MFSISYTQQEILSLAIVGISTVRLEICCLIATKDTIGESNNNNSPIQKITKNKIAP